MPGVSHPKVLEPKVFQRAKGIVGTKVFFNTFGYSSGGTEEAQYNLPSNAIEVRITTQTTQTTPPPDGGTPTGYVTHLTIRGGSYTKNAETCDSPPITRHGGRGNTTPPSKKVRHGLTRAHAHKQHAHYSIV